MLDLLMNNSIAISIFVCVYFPLCAYIMHVLKIQFYDNLLKKLFFTYILYSNQPVQDILIANKLYRTYLDITYVQKHLFIMLILSKFIL